MDDKQVLDLIFRPGFSTAARVTDLSGRGVTAWTLVRTCRDQAGRLDRDRLAAQGIDATFTLKLLLTLAILQVLMVRAAGEEFALPLDAVVRTLHVKREELAKLYESQPPVSRRRRADPRGVAGGGAGASGGTLIDAAELAGAAGARGR